PVCLVPRESLDTWLALADCGDPARDESRSAYARALLDVLAARGACFVQELTQAARLLPSHAEMGLAQLIAHGLVTCDSVGGLRRLVTPPSRRRGAMRGAPLAAPGRWSRLRGSLEVGHREATAAEIEFVAAQYLQRYGVVFRRLLERERIPVPWHEVVRVYR